MGQTCQHNNDCASEECDTTGEYGCENKCVALKAGGDRFCTLAGLHVGCFREKTSWKEYMAVRETLLPIGTIDEGTCIEKCASLGFKFAALYTQEEKFNNASPRCSCGMTTGGNGVLQCPAHCPTRTSPGIQCSDRCSQWEQYNNGNNGDSGWADDVCNPRGNAFDPRVRNGECEVACGTDRFQKWKSHGKSGLCGDYDGNFYGGWVMRNWAPASRCGGLRLFEGDNWWNTG